MIILGQDLIFTKVYRSGVLPFTTYNNKLYFLFGIDSITNDLTDFGGGVKPGENSLVGAIREFSEETKYIFGPTIQNPANYVDKLVLIDDKNRMSIVLLPISNRWLHLARTEFSRMHIDREECNENKDVMWISESELMYLMDGGIRKDIKLWRNIRKFFTSTGFSTKDQSKEWICRYNRRLLFDTLRNYS